MNKKIGNSFTTNMSKGSIILILICFIIICLWRLDVFRLKNETISNINMSEQEQINTWLAQNNTAADIPNSEKPYSSYDAVTTEENIPLRPFNPNIDSYDSLIAKGVPPKVAKNIVNYGKGQAVYKNASQLKKLYAVDEDTYKKLLPYIDIKSSETTFAKSMNNSSITSGNQQVKGYYNTNLNTSTKEELMRLKGIGQGYATRIIERRELLGGFYDIKQLKEIYGFPDSTYDALLPYFILHENDIKLKDINSLTEEELAAHPYIGKKMAKDIVRLRTDVGSFKRISDLRNIPLLNEEKYRKIAKYFMVILK